MFNRKGENLPVVQTSATVAVVGVTGSEIVTAGRIPKSVQRGVMENMLAFPTPGVPDGDRRIVLDLYFEAVAGFALAVVLWTLKFLVFNNPRNTPTFSCPPTPQDVREACQLTHGIWERCVTNFYFEGVWAKPTTSQMLKKDNDAILQRYYAAHKGGKPGELDCIIPEDLQIEYLRGAIERGLLDVEKEDEYRRRDLPVPLLFLIDEDLLSAMPATAFPDGALELLRNKRAARAAALRKEAEHNAYLRNLPDDVRAMRYIVSTSVAWMGRDESEIRTEVDRRLEDVRVAKREAEEAGGEFLGITFADGSEYRDTNHKRRAPLLPQQDEHANDE